MVVKRIKIIVHNRILYEKTDVEDTRPKVHHSTKCLYNVGVISRLIFITCYLILAFWIFNPPVEYRLTSLILNNLSVLMRPSASCLQEFIGAMEVSYHISGKTNIWVSEKTKAIHAIEQIRGKKWTLIRHISRLRLHRCASRIAIHLRRETI